jgi:hypothetical protein
MDLDLSLEAMEISDDALLGLTLNRDIPQPPNPPEPDNDANLIITQLDSNCPTDTQPPKQQPPAIINPYSRSSKERIGKIKQAILNSRRNQTQEFELPDNTAPEKTQTNLIDLLDDAATQSTTTTNKTHHQHGIE